MKEIFNQVEELTGTYPTGDNLRNAVHAIITKKHNYSHPLFNWNMVATQLILNNVDYIARTYEQNRGTTQSNPHKAFEDALASGVLTRATIGDYMYMYTDETKGDAFKNIMTRKYIYNK